MLKDISYRDYRRSDDIHGTVLYPAVMVAPVQNDILVDLSKDNTVNRILDPFHGSGTALYESHRVFPDAEILGCDINPFANLITRAKLTGVAPNIEDDIGSISRRLEVDYAGPVYDFPNRKKWFRDDVALSLTQIREAILSVSTPENRLFFWCMMSDVVRRYSNTRSSTYKLHIKPSQKINEMSNSAIADFLRSIRASFHQYEVVHCNNYRLFKQDALSCLPQFTCNNKVDVLITSPPYGDNQTTVPYGLFSSLALRWIDPIDLNLEGWELDNYSAIDSHSLGSSAKHFSLNSFQNNLLEPYISNISDQKAKKVKNYFYDYFRFLDQSVEAVEKFIVLTVGNRTVDRVKIDLASITACYLRSKGFVEHQTVSRDILNKRTPPLTSKVKDAPVESMGKEYVLIYKKNLAEQQGDCKSTAPNISQ